VMTELSAPRSSFSAPPKRSNKWQPRCPEGHHMSAKVARELLDLVRPSRYLNIIECDRCGEQITGKDARYRCRLCDIDYCMSCMSSVMHPIEPKISETQVTFDNRKTLLKILPGDIFLCGPDEWGIHHVVLASGEMRLAEKRVRDAFAVEDSREIYGCTTVETSASQTTQAPWYQTCSYYARNLETGEVELVGDMVCESNLLEIYTQGVPVKVLLHPLRPNRGGPELDLDTFERVVKRATAQSKGYCRITAVRAFVSAQGKLKQVDFPDALSRQELLKKIRRRWESPPICSSVAITVWQMYFDEMSRDAGHWATDLAVQHILEWIPVFCDNTTPSMLVKTLTESGWVLKTSLAAD